MNKIEDKNLENEISYCICNQKPSEYELDDFMIECDSCKDWLHGRCIDLNQLDAADIESFICTRCSNDNKQTIYKKRSNYHRHDFNEIDADKKPIQSGTPVFINNLLKKQFLKPDEILVKLSGSELKVDYFEKYGFRKPILVENKDELDIKVPTNFSLEELEKLLGTEYELEVIDVEKQQTVSMNANRLRKYFQSNNRNKIYNLISLEISKTRLNELVTMPKIVREISWAYCGILPENACNSNNLNQPDVQKYCLISAKNSFTDFHIDFGGSSVWYHVLKGSKYFYLIEPTKENLCLYEQWAKKVNNTEIAFSEQVTKCYFLELKEGHTIFLPSGYIHAVYTPSDSFVFGGNFLHSYNISLQLKIYEIENKLQIPPKYRFPRFRTLHWYAALYYSRSIKMLNKKNLPIQNYLHNGCKALKIAIKKWYYENQDINYEEIPDDIQCKLLIKVLSKELKKSKALLNKRYSKK